jgi:hypothetical protein
MRGRGAAWGREKRVSDAGVARLGHAFKKPKASQSPFFAGSVVYLKLLP